MRQVHLPNLLLAQTALPLHLLHQSLHPPVLLLQLPHLGCHCPQLLLKLLLPLPIQNKLTRIRIVIHVTLKLLQQVLTILLKVH